jgi:hypothetical protein
MIGLGRINLLRLTQDISSNMCLIQNSVIEAEVKRRLKNGSIEAWKVYQVRENKTGARYLLSPGMAAFLARSGKLLATMRSIAGRDYHHEGESKVPLSLTKEETTTREVTYGIHVYLNKEDADRAATAIRRLAVVKVICRAEHFRAAGFFNYSEIRNAVFIEVELPKEEYDKATYVTPSPPPPPTPPIREKYPHLKENQSYQNKGRIPAFYGITAVINSIGDTSLMYQSNGCHWECGIQYFAENFQ